MPSAHSPTPSSENLKLFKDMFPVLKMLSSEYQVDGHEEYLVDDSVQLVCKYLNAYKNNRINKLYKGT